MNLYVYIKLPPESRVGKDVRSIRAHVKACHRLVATKLQHTSDASLLLFPPRLLLFLLLIGHFCPSVFVIAVVLGGKSGLQAGWRCRREQGPGSVPTSTAVSRPGLVSHGSISGRLPNVTPLTRCDRWCIPWLHESWQRARSSMTVN